MEFLQNVEKSNLKKSLFGFVDTIMLGGSGIFASLPKPSNVIECASSDKFLGKSVPSIYDNKGQYYSLREFFQTYCPICNNFKSRDVFNMDKNALLKDVLLVYDWEKHIEYCPRCSMTKQEFMEDRLLKDYNVLLGIIGMRAGKTTLASIIMAFIEIFLVCHEDAKNLFGVPTVPFIEMGCVAVSEKQAKETIWAQYKTVRDNADWFKHFKEIISDNKYDKDGLYDEQTTLIKNDLVGLYIESLHSSSASLAGKTRVFYVVEEIGRFDTTQSKRSGKEVWRVGNSSLKTIKKAVKKKGLPPWLGSIAGIGSPTSVDDYGMKLLSSETDKMLKMKFATWQFFNDEYTEEDFADEFKDDPVGTKRDFGADPPGAETPFFEDWKLTSNLVENVVLEPLVTFGDVESEAVIVNFKDPITYIGKEILNIQYDRSEWVIAGDAGKSKDCFALVGAKRQWEGNDYSMLQGFVLHILPNAGMRRYVDFKCIVPIFTTLNRYLNITRVCFDYWNSELICRELMSMGLRTEFYSMSSLKTEDHYNFKQAAFNSKIHLLKKTKSEDGEPEEMDSFTRQYWEMKRMQRSKDLKKVDHSPHSTSDIYECNVNCWRMLNEVLKEEPTVVSGQSAMVGGIARGRW